MSLTKNASASPDPNRIYTVDDYLAWPEGTPYELIHGELYAMAPAPNLAHQRTARDLGYAISQALAARRGNNRNGGGAQCEVLLSPVDVVLGPDTVVQPDVLVVCDPRKLANGRYVDGPPNLVAEVLSPATALKDRREKRALYQTAGVLEYLVIDPSAHYAEIYRLQEGRYGEPEIWGPQDRLCLAILPELAVSLAELFNWPVEPEAG